MLKFEFGRRLAQGIVVNPHSSPPEGVEELKPLINIIEIKPVVQEWQIQMVFWLSEQYLAPLNGCMRLMLPPGMTRWADVTVELNPFWDGTGRLTDLQREIGLFATRKRRYARPSNPA